MEAWAAGRWAAYLGAAAAWAIAVPYAAAAAGLRLEVPLSVEIADHVVPGVVIVLAALALAAERSRAAPNDLRWSAAGAAAFLAGFWMIATHAPLLGEAINGVTDWPAAAAHLSAGPPAAAVGLAMLYAGVRGG